MNKITIDLEDLKNYLRTLPTEMDELYDEEWALQEYGIRKYVRTIDKDFADALLDFSRNYRDEVEVIHSAKEYQYAYEDRCISSEFGAAPIDMEKE